MVVRLLPKSEIDKRKSEEQRTAIQEGLKVAERVDTLRETLASEEVAFEKYRKESLDAIEQEIKPKRIELDLLNKEVSHLCEERRQLLIPLDFKWSEVQKLEEFNKSKEHELSVLDGELAEKSVLITTRERDVVIAEGKSEDLKRLASAMYTQAEAQLSKSREDSASILNKAHAELSLVEIQKQEVEKREINISIKEKALEEKEHRIEKYEIRLANREATLRAGWKNLEHTANKLK